MEGSSTLTPTTGKLSDSYITEALRVLQDRGDDIDFTEEAYLKRKAAAAAAGKPIDGIHAYKGFERNFFTEAEIDPEKWRQDLLKGAERVWANWRNKLKHEKPEAYARLMKTQYPDGDIPEHMWLDSGSDGSPGSANQVGDATTVQQSKAEVHGVAMHSKAHLGAAQKTKANAGTSTGETKKRNSETLSQPSPRISSLKRRLDSNKLEQGENQPQAKTTRTASTGARNANKPKESKKKLKQARGKPKSFRSLPT